MLCLVARILVLTMTNKSLFIIKPDAVAANNIGAILSLVEKGGFKIVAQRMMKMDAGIASRFYLEHKERPFYQSLVEYMSSGSVVLCVLSKNNAINDLRNLIGHTDPLKADNGTIRKLFGKSIEANAAHASDSENSALREIKFFFAEIDIIE